jgi:cation transport ATPase
VARQCLPLIIALLTSIGMIKDLLRGHWGIDVLAVMAIVTTVAVGEYLAALAIVLMLSGGEALEDYAAGRAKRELTHCWRERLRLRT